MAVIGQTALTLADLATRIGPDGTIAPMINMVSQNNEVMEDMMWVEGNLPTGHRTSQLVGIPQGAWRLLNYGVPYVKAQSTTVTDSTAILEAFVKTDMKLVQLAPDPRAFRLSEEQPVVQGMSIQVASALFYGNHQTNPSMFTGLAPRYSTVQTAVAPNAANVIDGGGTGSTNTSIWIICWGPNTVTGIYPKGSKAGLDMKDVTTDAPVYDALGQPYSAYQTKFTWDCGLSLRDWRYVVRIANVDAALLQAGGGAALIDLIIQAVNLPPTFPASAASVQGTAGGGGVAGLPLSAGRAAIYCNRRVKTWLHIQSRKDAKAFLNWETIQGKPVMTFLGVPIRTTDALLNTEARVV